MAGDSVHTENSESQRSFSFGWFSFRPKWLQILNTPRWFLFFLCQYFFTQSIVVNGVFPGSISTIERRFGYTSSMTGWLTSSFDIFATILTPLISYVGGSRKKPVFCGVGLFTMALGFFVFLLPHVISEKYQVGEVYTGNVSGLALCSANETTRSTSDICDGESIKGNLWYYCIFVLGMLLAGAGATPMYALGIPYMDENVKRKVSPMYVGLFEASGILGAVVGFVVVFALLSIFVDLRAQPSITPEDQRWVGAWWLGFAIFGVLCAFWSFWLLGFPKEFPGSRARREIEMVDNRNKEFHEEECYTKLSDIPRATRMVFSRLPFVTLTLGACMENFLITASVAFMPKILQSKFRLLPGSAALLYGCVSIPAALLGSIVGAYINKRLNLSMRGAAKMCFIVAVLGFLSSFFLYINCDQVEIAGVNQPYVNSSSTDDLSSWCNSECDCSGVSYSPVCARGRTYFSPCHAGCSAANPSESYSNCSCVVTKSEAWGEAISGACGVNCGVKHILFMAALLVSSFLIFVNSTPAIIVILRSAPVGQRSYALGLQIILGRLLGAIPGPIVLGSLIDRTCVLWNISCGNRSNCLEYNTTQLTMVVAGLFVACKFITMVFFFVTWLLCRK